MDKAVSKEKEDSVKRLAEREAHIYQAKHSILSFWGRIEGITTNGLDQQMKMLDEPPQQLES